jgi:RimJ/RimL family protein N-acetyltransferase
MLAHALASLAEVRFVVGETNTRSRTALERIGAVLTDRREQRVMADGAVVDHLTYVITRESFASGPLSSPVQRKAD